MEVFTQATIYAATAVLIITEALKIVPVEFTSKYPAWVNAILSVIAAFIVVNPTINLSDLPGTLVTALLIGTTAALAFNHFTSKLVNLGSVGAN